MSYKSTVSDKWPDPLLLPISVPLFMQLFPLIIKMCQVGKFNKANKNQETDSDWLRGKKKDNEMFLCLHNQRKIYTLIAFLW